MSEKMKYLIIHCTASRTGVDVTAEKIIKWHTEDPPDGRGWSRVGYSDMIDNYGRLVNLRSYDQNDIVEDDEKTWGTAGKNSCSRHLVYAGGLDGRGRPSDTRTEAQKKTMLTYIKYNILRVPDLLVAGHYHFAAKACPCFNVPEWLAESGIPTENIYRNLND